jgi:capsular polysaccharide biosynthesis protein
LTLPIAVAATIASFFERSHPFQGRSEIRLGEAFSHQMSGANFQASKMTAAIRNYTLENVVLDADTLLLRQDGLLISATGYFVPEDRGARLRIDQGALVRLDTNEDIIIGYNNAHRGYQHWLTECLPAIDWSLRQPRTRGYRLLLPTLEPWQEDFLRILGYGAVPRLALAAGVQYFLPRAEYSEFLNGSSRFEICLSTRNTARRVLNALPPFPPPHKIVYVRCSNPYYGAIDNEAEVVDLLQRRGVYILDQRRLGTVDRINLFRNAEVVIGPSGQGLTDVLFCKPGALLWEWMPDHHQNVSFNRLAQAAEVDYWGDLFESRTNPEIPGQWHIDLGVVSRRLSELSIRLALRAAKSKTKQAPTKIEVPPANPVLNAIRKPLEELMLAFESLGDNCEFGLVQRHGGAEPLGLLRFAGIFLPIEIRLERLAAALERKFEGLGAAETITVYLDGEPNRREFLVRESAYDLMYHTGVPEGAAGLEEMRVREITRLSFLRRKFFEDLETGAKIWVWKSAATVDAEQVQPLLHVLRTLGPNTLLWVVEGDERHRPGSIERLDRDFIKGYVERFAPYDSAPDIRPASWFEVCQRTYDLCHPSPITPKPRDIPAVQPPLALSAIELPSKNQADVSQSKFEPVAAEQRLLSWLKGLDRPN